MAVLLSNLMISVNEGMFGNMLDTMTRSFLGHIQLHEKGYWDEQTLENTMEQHDALAAKLLASENIEGVTPRFQSFALASFGIRTRGAQIVGVDPQHEEKLMDLQSRITEGRTIEAKDNGILLGFEMAKFLQINVGDTLVLIGQGYRGVSAAGKHEVVGLLKMPSSGLNSNLVIMSLPTAQYLFGAEERVTGYTVVISNQNNLQKVENEILSVIDTSTKEVLTWPELMPELVQMKTTKIAGSYIYVGILYLIAGFGIFATILMMMSERSYELGVMLSVGMSRFRLIIMLMIETLLLSSIGVLAGTAISYPIMAYMKAQPVLLSGPSADAMIEMGFEPLMMTSTDPIIFITNGLILFIISFLIVAYPTISIWRMNAVNAMRK